MNFLKAGRLRHSTLQGKSFVLCVLLLAVFSGSSAVCESLREGTKFESGDCYARLTGDQLEMGNTHVRRTWRIDHGQLYATSFFDLDRHVEWMGLPAVEAAPAVLKQPDNAVPLLRGASGTFGPTEEASLRVELEETHGPAVVDYEFQIFPDATGIRIWTVRKGKGATASAGSSEDPSGEKDGASGQMAVGDALEHLRICKLHLRLTQVILRDRTDERNELVFEEEWLLHPNEAQQKLQGNIFLVEDVLTGDGLIFLKEAPQPEMRPLKTEYDASFTGTSMSVPARSVAKGQPHYKIDFYGDAPTADGKGYSYTLMAYHGGRPGRIAALHRYQRQIRQYVAGRDGQMVSNTWGDRSLGDKLNEDFVRREIDAGKKLGVDIMQIDDGWESGNTMNLSTPGGVWDGFWEANPNFWVPNGKRFPHGMAPLSEYARSRGMKLGLWFGPDSYRDFVNWRKDADQILSFNRNDHIDVFKFDSVKIRSRQGERNYRSLTAAVLKESSGKILLDLDVTAETRQGYLGDIAAGPLFVENRYTDTHRYWPHQTLRNLWKLSQYIDPLRLRMEFLNSGRNPALYVDDPLAPAQYKSDCLFAMTMFSSPLAWFETTGLSPDYVHDLAPLVTEWKRQREAIYRGKTLPIGDAPDGVTWTGFASIDATQRGGYLLVFRELNGQSHWTAPGGLFGPGSFKIVPMGGAGKVTQKDDGFEVEIPQPLGFVWVKLEGTNKT